MNFNIFKAADENKKLVEVNAELIAEKAKLLTRIGEMEKELNESHETITSFLCKEKEFNASLETGKAEYEVKIATLDTQMKMLKEKEDTAVKAISEAASEVAMGIVACMGVPAETIKVSVEDLTKTTSGKYKFIDHLKK